MVGQEQPLPKPDSLLSSSNNTKVVVCENCDKRTQQKELPDDSIASIFGNTCGDAYRAVSLCMTNHKGQVSACSREWDIFRSCHDNDRNKNKNKNNGSNKQ
jgi:hypothetical protein